MVVELDMLSIIFIFCGLKECYENYYKVCIKDEVIIVVVELSNCYIIECFFLDKVIDLMDEVVVKLCMECDFVFEELDEILCYLK